MTFADRAPFWQERSFEGRLVRISALSEEEEVRTSWGTRWAMQARVAILDGRFAGHTFERVPIFAPPLKRQLLEKGHVEGRLGRGAALKGAPVQWVVKETAVQG